MGGAGGGQHLHLAEKDGQNYSYDFVLESIIISTIMGLLTIIAISTWVVAGNILLNLLRNDLQRKIINYLLGFALILTAIWIILT